MISIRKRFKAPLPRLVESKRAALISISTSNNTHAHLHHLHQDRWHLLVVHGHLFLRHQLVLVPRASARLGEAAAARIIARVECLQDPRINWALDE